MQIRQSLAAKKAAILSVLMLASVAAHAEVPAIVDTTLTQIQTDGTSMFTKVFPVVGAILGLMIVLKLFKRFTNKI